MAHSLEIRLPFLDHNLIELAFRVPPRLKNNGSATRSSSAKSQRNCCLGKVTHRKKNPFFLPMEFFFEHPQIRRLIAETLNEYRVRKRG